MSLTDEEEGYVYQRRYALKRIKIPEDHVKCKACRGSGDLRVYYGGPHDRGQFTDCWFCAGKGYVDKERAEELDKGHRHVQDYWK